MTDNKPNAKRVPTTQKGQLSKHTALSRMKKHVAVDIGCRGYRVLSMLSNPHSTSQIATLEFSSRKKASETLKRLFDAGLVNRTPRPVENARGKTEYVHWLSQKGAKVVFESGYDSCRHLTQIRQWSIARLEHQLLANDFRIVVHLFCGKYPNLQYQVVNHRTAQLLVRSTRLIPDDIILIHKTSMNKTLLFFIEIDLAVESIKGVSPSSLETKVRKYLLYFDSGNSRRDFPDTKGFRILLLTTTKIRANSISNLAAQLGAIFVCSTTFNQITPTALTDEIWAVPGEDEPQRLLRDVL